MDGKTEGVTFSDLACLAGTLLPGEWNGRHGVEAVDGTAREPMVPRAPSETRVPRRRRKEHGRACPVAALLQQFLQQPSSYVRSPPLRDAFMEVSRDLRLANERSDASNLSYL